MDYKRQAQELPWGKGVEILSVNGDGLLAVAKPAGLLSHPNSSKDRENCVLKCGYDMKEQCFLVQSEESTAKIYLINRLDSATSGVLILALDPRTAAAAKAAFAGKRVRKVYHALAFGVASRGDRLWKDRVSTKRASRGVRSRTGGGALAETKLVSAKPIPGVPVMSLLTLMPLTGKTHQLRLQCAERSLPIVGDRTYGDFAKNKQVAKSKKINRLCLHCWETEIQYSLSGARKQFKARSPSPFRITENGLSVH